MADDKIPNPQPPITIKKYANRRLYNTATSSYVTLDHLSQMVKENTDFVVYDAKTGEDITRSVLTQIIVEEEQKSGQNLLPISFLRSLIGFYGDSLGRLLPRYLDYSMGTFQHNEGQMRKYMENMLGGLFPFSPLEEMAKQNMNLFENAMKMFAPFYQGGPGAPGGAGAPPAANPGDAKPLPDKPVLSVADLLARINAMQEQLNRLAGGSSSAGREPEAKDKDPTKK